MNKKFEKSDHGSSDKDEKKKKQLDARLERALEIFKKYIWIEEA